jgi:hypothetical protein
MTMQRRRRKAAFLVVIACVGIANVSRSPSFAATHALFLLQFFASGMCIGSAMALLFLKVAPDERPLT